MDKNIKNMKKVVLNVEQSDAVLLYKESLINSLEDLLDNDWESNLTVQSIIHKLENNEL